MFYDGADFEEEDILSRLPWSSLRLYPKVGIRKVDIAYMVRHDL